MNHVLNHQLYIRKKLIHTKNVKKKGFSTLSALLIPITLLLLLFIDIEPPVITTPNNVPMMNVDTGMPDAVIIWSSPPSALDAFEGIIPTANIRCENQAGNVVVSGGRYPVGTTTVTCRANDTALNEGSSQFNITVIGMYHLSLLTERILLQFVNILSNMVQAAITDIFVFCNHGLI